MRVRGRTWRLAAVCGGLFAVGVSMALEAQGRGQPAPGRPPLEVRWLEGRVMHVTDGDSLWWRPAAGGRSTRVRLLGVDAPEICQAGGVAAKSALDALVLGQTVQLESRGHDDHGRMLARIRLADGTDLGARLVGAGQAWSYRYRGDAGPYAAEEARAVAGRRGLHAQAGAVLPREFRQRHGPCR